MQARYLPFAMLLSALCQLQVPNAYGLESGFLAPGSTAVISIDPVLPIQGESITINITGEWKDRCIPDQSTLNYSVTDATGRSNPEVTAILVRITAALHASNDCGSGFEQTPYQLSLTIPGPDTVEMAVTVDISGLLPDNRVGHMYWNRAFDLVLGLHEIPPGLHSGYWLSKEAPFQALVIEQQGATVVFHELTYNRIIGTSKWLYADGKFHGNKLDGIAYRVHWRSPVQGATRTWINNPSGNPSIIPQDRLVQPEKQDLAFDASSAGISVGGVNRIGAYLWLHDLNGDPGHRIGYSYRPWVFAHDAAKLPAIVPDMSGAWTLYGFNGQQLEQSYSIEFRAGSKTGQDLYRFSSIDGSWVLDCPITIEGEGDCTLEAKKLGLTMHFDLYNAYAVTHYHIGSQFNGNFAIAPLVSSNSAAVDETGVLLRVGLHLPVLDLQ